MLVVLSSHLCGDLLFGRHLGDQPRLADGVGQRLFTINIQTSPQSAYGGRCVMVIRRSHHNSVQILLFEQFAVVEVFLGGGQLARGSVEAVLINITERDDVLAGHALQIAGTTATYANDTNVQSFVCAEGARRKKDGGGSGSNSESGGGLDKTTAVDSGTHGVSFDRLSEVVRATQARILSGVRNCLHSRIQEST